jgi:hypothetical protein
MKTVLTALALLCATSPALAKVEQDIYCAEIKKNVSQGYLALRKGPSVSSQLLAKLEPGWEIQFDKNLTRGDWLRVIYVSELDDENYGVSHKMTSGWVHRSQLNKPFECGC